MKYQEKLQLWVREALGALGGESSVNDVAKHIWDNHQGNLKLEGDRFYSWQYDMRWAAQQLCEEGMAGLRKQGGKTIRILKQ